MVSPATFNSRTAAQSQPGSQAVPIPRVGQCILQSKDRISEAHDRRIKEDVQRAVYARDNNTCRICGWSIDRWSPENPRILELHHLQHHKHGGKNVAKNLIVVCSKCHDEVHAGKHAPVIARISKTL